LTELREAVVHDVLQPMVRDVKNSNVIYIFKGVKRFYDENGVKNHVCGLHFFNECKSGP